jgi:hypothetical protein
MMSDLEHCLAILKALHIVEVSYCLSGGGDSGTAELNHVLYDDGTTGPLPTVTLAVTDVGGIVCLDERLENIIYDLPEGDWINNEGGYGNVVLRPQESDPDCQVECNMTYGEDSDESDFEDDGDQLLAPDFSDADPAPLDEPIAIDDSALQPAKGDSQ